MSSPPIVKSSRHDQPGSLELLPPEILLQIVTNISGLDTLWNLLKASPHTFRLFNSHALEITEGILSGPNSILPHKIQELVRGVILVRSKVLPFENLNEFQEDFMRPMLPFAVPRDRVVKTLGPELLSASTVSVAVLRSVVATAYQASALSQACLESCLARVRAPSFRPLHSWDPQPHYTHDYNRPGKRTSSPVRDVPAWDREFVGTPAKVVDSGQPTWVEEMRALRAMWLIQVAGEVQRLVADKAGTVGWSDEDIDKLVDMDPVDLLEIPRMRFTRFSVAREVETAIEYLSTLGDATKDVYYRLPRPPSASTSSRWITALPNENESTMVVRGFRQNNKFQFLCKGSSVPADAEPVKLPVFTDDCHWGQTKSALERPSFGASFFGEVSSKRDARPQSPIIGVKFDSFRPLGFAFWDQLRMHLLGLAPNLHPGRPMSRGFYIFAWESILPLEEVASLKAALREGRQDVSN